MKKEIIINDTTNEVRIAITEDKRLAELYVETPERERLVGDIFFGKIARVMPGIRAAFIDIGHKQDAFLHFSDIGSSYDEYATLVGEEADMDDDDDDDDGDDSETESPEQNDRRPNSRPNNRQGNHHSRPPRGRSNNYKGQSDKIPNLTAGQDIIVQVTKEPVGKKGVRVTSEISLPGRFLVLMPFNGRIGASKKISNFREKRRLRRIVRSILPPGFGVIIRTVAQEREESELTKDLQGLIDTWREIEKQIKESRPPMVLYKDMATTDHVIRDLFTDTVERVVIDSKRLHKDIRTYLEDVSPHLLEKVELYTRKEPIFDVYGIEKEIVTLLGRKVWLKSGGYVIIEQTEAMVVIDVNSGRYAAKKEQEQNSLKTNLEAAREVCRQLRLRDIGGIIVIDFIDLDDESSKKKVYDELRKEFRKDRAKVTVLPLTDFGIAQITRQRIRQSVLHSFSEPCPVCGGAGLVQSKAAIFSQLERWLRRFKGEDKEMKIRLKVNPAMAEYLNEGFMSRRRKLMLNHFIYIVLEGDAKVPISDYHFYSTKEDKEITEQYQTT